MTIRICSGQSKAPGKLGEAELHFDESDGLLAGLKLVGFAIWERSSGGRNVTYPARQYAINGERRTFALLRPLTADTSGALREAILAAFAAQEKESA